MKKMSLRLRLIISGRAGGARLALGLSRKYVCWYCKNFRDARKFRENYVRINEMEAAVAEIRRYFDSCGETV